MVKTACGLKLQVGYVYFIFIWNTKHDVIQEVFIYVFESTESLSQKWLTRLSNGKK